MKAPTTTKGIRPAETVRTPATPIATAPASAGAPSPHHDAAAEAHPAHLHAGDPGLRPQANDLLERVARIEVRDAAREEAAGLAPLARDQPAERGQADPHVEPPQRAPEGG